MRRGAGVLICCVFLLHFGGEGTAQTRDDGNGRSDLEDAREVSPSVFVFPADADEESRAGTGPVDIFETARRGAAGIEPPSDIPPVPEFGPENPFMPIGALAPKSDVDENGAPLPLPPGDEIAAAFPGSIDVSDLGGMDPASVGTISDGEAGLGASLFAGLSYEEAEVLVRNLPVSRQSSVLHDMRRRALLTSAVPRGERSGTNLLGLRLARLAAQGDVLAMLELVEVVPEEVHDEVIGRYRADAFLARGNNAAACDEANLIVERSQDTYWFQLLGFCQTLSGQPEMAALAADLLREEGIEDAAYFTLLERIGKEDAEPLDSLAEPTLLHLAMLSTARMPVPGDAFLSPDHMVRHVLARSPNADLEQRLVAALDAESLGIFERNTVSEIYAAISFAPREFIAWEQEGVVPAAPLTLPFLFQAAMAAPNDAERARILGEMWAAGEEHGSGSYGVALAALPAIRLIEPDPTLARWSAGIVRALVLGGDYERALAWFGELVKAGPATDPVTNPEVAAAYLELWPIMQFVHEATSRAQDPYIWPDEAALIWGQRLLADATPERRRWMGLFYMMAEALGHPVEEEIWRLLVDRPMTETGHTPSYAAWRALARAAAARRTGEVALLSLIALGNNGVEEAHPAAVSTVLSAMLQVGLREEANRLAAEVLIARGP